MLHDSCIILSQLLVFTLIFKYFVESDGLYLASRHNQNWLHHKCPGNSCYDPGSNHCSVEACEVQTKAATTPVTMIIAPHLSYDCKQVPYTCKKRGVFVNPLDPSVWFECTMPNPTGWDKGCKECPKYTCFDVKSRSCVVNCLKINDDLFKNCKEKWTRKCETLREMG